MCNTAACGIAGYCISSIFETQASFHGGNDKVMRNTAAVHTVQSCSMQSLLSVQVQAEQALQNITAAMEQASGHRQEAAVLKNQLAADQVILPIACPYMKPANCSCF